MKTQTTEVISYIEEGTVIDHIRAGQALTIVQFLKLNRHSKQISIGINLPSTTYGNKDIIKIEQWELSPTVANRVALYAPEATISIIRNHEVINKFKVAFPESIQGCAPCPNSRCITNLEAVESFFFVTQRSNHTQLSCKYCRKSFTQADITI